MEFEGWAWGGNETNGDADKKAVIGWLSFNCNEGGYNEGTGEHYSVCGTSDYKVMTGLVVNQPPLAAISCGDEPDYDCIVYENNPLLLMS